MAEGSNTIKSADLAKVSEVDFVDQFKKGIDALKKALGITRMIEKVAGQVVKTYKVTGTLQSGTVAEGADIPLSKYETEVGEVFELDIDKWRKQTTLEAIADKGYEQAVIDTDTAMRSDIQSHIRGKWFAFLTKITGRTGVKGKGLKGALARLWAKLSALTEEYGVTDNELIYFVNQEDIADFLSDDKNYESRAEVFGFIYLKAFLGLYDVMVSSNVTVGKVFATPKNNLIIYYLNPANSDIAAVWDFTTDETGLVGIMHTAKGENLTTDTVAVCGVSMYAEIETFIAYADILGEGDDEDDGASNDEKTDPPQVQPGEENQVPDSVNSSSTTAQLEAYAAAHDIDLTGCNTNAEKLAAIQAAENVA